MSRGRPPRVLVVWCPDWPVIGAGATPGCPAVVLHANRVVAASPTAREEGVRIGQRRREAQAACPGLTVLAHDPARDTRAFEPVLHALEEITPWLELDRPGSCVFGARGPSRYHGGDVALADRVAEVVARALGSRASAVDPPGIGVADGRFTAEVAARHAVGGRPMVIPEGRSGAFLAPFPIATLATVEGLEPMLLELLPRLGLRTLGALAALPARTVVDRFGPGGRLAHRLAAGGDERPLDARRPAPELAVQAEFEPPVPQAGPVAFMAKQLADELHDRLAADGLVCIRMVVIAETEHGERHERIWRHDHGFRAAGMAERVRWQLDGWAGGPAPPTGGISLLRLVPDEVVSDRGRQMGFWGGRSEADERAARAVARLSAHVGVDAVAVPEWRGGRGPKDQLVLVPAAATDLTERHTNPPRDAGPWPGRLPSPSPATVLGVPVPIDVLDTQGRPVIVNARGSTSTGPARLVTGTRLQTVIAWAGPWLADERWWDPPAHRRRARFQMLTATGAAHLVAWEGGRWWLEATYD